MAGPVGPYGVYVVTHNSPVRYHIQGADDDSASEIDDDKIKAIKTAEAVTKIFSDSTNVFELEVKFKNIFKKGCPVIKQVMSATKASFNPSDQKITCEFVPSASVPICFSYNHGARYSVATLFLKTKDERVALERVTTYIDMSSDHAYNISSQTLHFRAQLEKITGAIKRQFEDSTLSKVKRNLFPTADDVPVEDAYIINNGVKCGGIFYVEKAKFEFSVS